MPDHAATEAALRESSATWTFLRTREYLTVLRPLLHGEHVRHSGEFLTVDTELDISAPPPRC